MRSILIGLCVALLPLSVSAVVHINCTSKLTPGFGGAIVYNNGNLTINPLFRGDWLTLCNVNSAINSVNPIVCASWVTIAARAAAGDLKVRVRYESLADGSTCDTLPTYGNAPPPKYFGLIMP